MKKLREDVRNNIFVAGVLNILTNICGQLEIHLNSKKKTIFRVELNGSRNTIVQSQHYVNDLEAQRKQLEARLHAEAENHKHYINTLQGQIQYHATRAQGLQVSLDSVQQQQVNIISKSPNFVKKCCRKGQKFRKMAKK